jgi:DNA polymerase-3 subunit gamma/tau
MAAVLQRMAVAQAAPGLPVDDTDPDAPDIARLSTQLPADETQLLYSLCIHGRAELGLAPDEYAGLTMALLRLLPFKRPADGAAATAEKKTLNPAEAPALADSPPPLPTQPLSVREQPTPRNFEPKQAETPARGTQAATELIAVKVREADDEPPPSRPTPAPALRPVQASADGDFWHTLVQELVAREAVTALARELALQAQLVARQPDAWTLRVENQSLAHEGVSERLQSALAEVGHAVRLAVETGAVTDSPARRNAIAASQRLKVAESLLMADPFVQEMMRDFGAKIVPGSLKPL